jgi:hypothetical protein
VAKQLAAAYNNTSHTSILPGNFFTKNDIIPRPSYSPDLAPATFLFPQLKIKGCHFVTVGVNKAESKAVLNTHTELDLQDAF